MTNYRLYRAAKYAKKGSPMARIAELEKENAQLKARIAELEKENAQPKAEKKVPAKKGK